MICPCGRSTIPARHLGQPVKLCTRCGLVIKLDYRTGQGFVIWPARRRGRKVS